MQNCEKRYLSQIKFSLQLLFVFVRYDFKSKRSSRCDQKKNKRVCQKKPIEPSFSGTDRKRLHVLILIIHWSLIRNGPLLLHDQ